MRVRSAIVAVAIAAMRCAIAADEPVTGPSSLAVEGAKGAERVSPVVQGHDVFVRLLKSVNDYFGSFRQASDFEVWGHTDYWATPREFQARGSGDCEDFAIAKFFRLLALGVPEDNLRLVLAHLWDSRQMTISLHMVVAYYATLESDPMILDNVVPGIHALSERRDLLPRFAFNRKAWWTMRDSLPVVQSGHIPLTRWSDVLTRIESGIVALSGDR